jgi:hypothetical protein
LFYAQQRSALLGDPSVTEKKMFGTTALCAGGKVLLFSWRDTLMVKTPAAQVQDLPDLQFRGLLSGRRSMFVWGVWLRWPCWRAARVAEELRDEVAGHSRCFVSAPMTVTFKCLKGLARRGFGVRVRLG